MEQERLQRVRRSKEMFGFTKAVLGRKGSPAIPGRAPPMPRWARHRHDAQASWFSSRPHISAQGTGGFLGDLAA